MHILFMKAYTQMAYSERFEMWKTIEDNLSSDSLGQIMQRNQNKSKSLWGMHSRDRYIQWRMKHIGNWKLQKYWYGRYQ